MKLLKSILTVSVVLALFVVLEAPVSSQQFAAPLHSANRAFQPGEELIYKAEVSRSLLRRVDVATFRFVIISAPGTGETPVVPLKLVGDVASEGLFARLFNINFHQHVESTVSPDSLAVQTTVKLDEQGKRKRTSEAVFDQTAHRVTWTERDANDPNKEPRVVSSEFNGNVYDIVSSIYYLRTERLDPGRSFTMSISDSGRVYDVPVRVVEKKRMKTVLGRTPVVRVDPDLYGAGLVKNKCEFNLWLSDDQRHIPVSVKLKTDYGTFDINLKRVSNIPSH